MVFILSIQINIFDINLVVRCFSLRIIPSPLPPIQRFRISIQRQNITITNPFSSHFPPIRDLNSSSVTNNLSTFLTNLLLHPVVCNLLLHLTCLQFKDWKSMNNSLFLSPAFNSNIGDFKSKTDYLWQILFPSSFLSLYSNSTFRNFNPKTGNL